MGKGGLSQVYSHLHRRQPQGIEHRSSRWVSNGVWGDDQVLQTAVWARFGSGTAHLQQLRASWGSAFASYSVAPDGERFLVLATGTGTGPPTLSLFLNWKEELESR